MAIRRVEMAKIRFSKKPHFFIFAPFICWFSLYTALDRAIFSLSSSENQKLKFLKAKKIWLSEEWKWQKFDFQKNPIFFIFRHLFVGFLFIRRWIEQFFPYHPVKTRS